MSENEVWASCALFRGRFGKAGVQARDNPKHVLISKGVLLSPFEILRVRAGVRAWVRFE